MKKVLPLNPQQHKELHQAVRSALMPFVLNGEIWKSDMFRYHPNYTGDFWGKTNAK